MLGLRGVDICVGVESVPAEPVGIAAGNLFQELTGAVQANQAVLPGPPINAVLIGERYRLA